MSSRNTSQNASPCSGASPVASKLTSGVEVPDMGRAFASVSSGGADLLSAPPVTIEESSGAFPPDGVKGPRVLLHGVDTAYFSCFVSWGSQASTVFETIRIAKGQAKLEGSKGLANVGGYVISVHPTGTKKADGPYYEYRVTVDGFDIELRDPERQNEQIPDVVVKCGAIKCLELGNSIANVWEAAKQAIERLDGFVEIGLPSRVDRFFDLGIEFDEVFTAFERNDLVCRGRSKQAFGVIERKVTKHMMGSRPEGFSVGGDVMLRCYDKRREMVRQADKALMLQARWAYDGGVSRVEFQLRRDALKSRGIVTCEDLIELWDKLTAYLVKSWASFRVGAGVDRRNLKRKALYPFWQVLREHLSIAEFVPLARIEPEHVRRRRQQWVAQINGCLVSWAAEEGIEGMDGYLSILEILPDALIEDGLRGPVDRLHERRHYRESRWGGGAVEAERLRRASLALASYEDNMLVMEYSRAEAKAWGSRRWLGKSWEVTEDVQETVRRRN